MPVHAHDMCHSRSSRVSCGSPSANVGSTDTTGVFHPMTPASTSAASMRVVIGLVIEAIRKRVLTVTGAGAALRSDSERTLVNDLVIVDDRDGRSWHVEIGHRAFDEEVEARARSWIDARRASARACPARASFPRARRSPPPAARHPRYHHRSGSRTDSRRTGASAPTRCDAARSVVCTRCSRAHPSHRCREAARPRPARARNLVRRAATRPRSRLPHQSRRSRRSSRARRGRDR